MYAAMRLLLCTFPQICLVSLRFLRRLTFNCSSTLHALQVVAGIKYGLDLHLAPALSCTHADAASPQALADCKLDSANPIAVHASVVHQPWMATKDAAKEWQVSFEK